MENEDKVGLERKVGLGRESGAGKEGGAGKGKWGWESEVWFGGEGGLRQYQYLMSRV